MEAGEQHWETIWAQRAPDELSWYQRCSDRSLELIRSVAPGRAAPIIDVGGGASRLMAEAAEVDGYVTMATFGPDGPTTCSRLPVERYDASALAAAVGDRFAPRSVVEEAHVTPGGVAQQFLYGVLRRAST